MSAFQLPGGFSVSTVMEWLFTRAHFIQMAVALTLLLLLPSIFKVVWKQWRLFVAFQKVPADPKYQHIIFGHAPKYVIPFLD